MTMPTPIFLNQFLMTMNLFQRATLFCSRDIVDLKIQLSGWPRAFWPISQELEFSQI